MTKKAYKFFGKCSKRLKKEIRSQCIHFHTIDGVRILSVATPWSTLGHIDVDGRIRLRCKIEELPLIPGRYWITVGAGSADKLLDWLEGVCMLTVQPTQNTEIDLIPKYRKEGYFWVEALWEVE